MPIICPWCEECTATTEITTESGDKEVVCAYCALDYEEWLREEDSALEGEFYDGPYFADTMSGGCVYLRG